MNELAKKSIAASVAIAGALLVAAFVAASFYLVCRVLMASSGRDDDVYGRTDRRFFVLLVQAEHELQKFSPPVAKNGVYVENIFLSSKFIQELLVEKHFAFIEGNAAPAHLLKSHAADPDALAARALGNTTIRLSLADDAHPDCFQFKTDGLLREQWDASRPGRCLHVDFDNTMRSQLFVRANTAQVDAPDFPWHLLDSFEGREFHWELIDVQSRSVLLSLRSVRLQRCGSVYCADGVLTDLLEKLTFTPASEHDVHGASHVDSQLLTRDKNSALPPAKL